MNTIEQEAYRLAAAFADHCRIHKLPAGTMYDGVCFGARAYGDRPWAEAYKAYHAAANAVMNAAVVRLVSPPPATQHEVRRAKRLELGAELWEWSR